MQRSNYITFVLDFIPVCSIPLRMYYKYIYDISLYLLSQQHVSALWAIFR
jgi:hypothetical protein